LNQLRIASASAMKGLVHFEDMCVARCWLLRELAAATANPVLQQQQEIARMKQHWHFTNYTRRRAVSLDIRQLLLRFMTKSLIDNVSSSLQSGGSSSVVRES
jgi:hypothetical protein